ncbi:hypothetical protein RYH80_04700 [Halobaculum sp. MBLA0147]|uniref:hypothetical protein n=1 Tax=Halobaculum sp. MBLA0147 TaxID=3079934 RepID=UPI00352643BA
MILSRSSKASRREFVLARGRLGDEALSQQVLEGVVDFFGRRTAVPLSVLADEQVEFRRVILGLVGDVTAEQDPDPQRLLEPRHRLKNQPLLFIPFVTSRVGFGFSIEQLQQCRSQTVSLGEIVQTATERAITVERDETGDPSLTIDTDRV